MIYEYFRAARAYAYVHVYRNDDVQDFEGRWDQALLSVSEMPSNMILEGMYNSMTEFCSTSDCIDFV